MAEQKYLRDGKWITIKELRELNKKNKKTSKKKEDNQE